MCRQQSCENSELAVAKREVIRLHQNVLVKDNQQAEDNRILFRHMLTLNLLSSAGAGKTTLIHRLLSDLVSTHPIASQPTLSDKLPIRAGVIAGDLATERDAERLRQTGVPVVQITTGNLCHLEAKAVAQAARQLDLIKLNLLLIENVGNLVCPAEYDLGEDLRIVLMSVTEGEDKPLKYPAAFESADAVVISKCDLTRAAHFKRVDALEFLSRTAPQARVFELSAQTGIGLTPFYGYLIHALRTHLESIV